MKNIHNNTLSSLEFGVRIYAIIVAGGNGSRMKTEIPKQFLPLNGKPILIHTIEKFLQIPAIEIIIVLPKNDIDYWDEMAKLNETIQNSYRVAAEKGTAVTSVWVKDSVRQYNEKGESTALDRTKLKLVQTPQTFQVNLMKKAFEVSEQSFFTDCASVLEFSGQNITLIDGSYENIKITTPEDIIIAEAFLRAHE
jgi:2-C-methyl-D-erythritol 4-phosphate cytidylyltransferase